MVMLFDTHAHLDDDLLFSQTKAVISRAEAAGVGWINSVGCDLASSRRNVELAEKYPNVYATVGVHPSEDRDMNDAAMTELVSLAKSPKVVAWGEIGLDYHYDDDTPRKVQQEYFDGRQDDLRAFENVSLISAQYTAGYDYE